MDGKPNFLYKTLPRKHQEQAFYFIYSLFMSGTNYGALLMQQGTGKTKVTIDIASNLYKEGKIDAVLLIAPNGVQDQWRDEQLPMHSPIPYNDLTWSLSPSKKYARELKAFTYERSETIKWFYVNVEAFSKDTHLDVFRTFVERHNCLVVVDESTRIKTPKSARTINVIQGLSKITKERGVVTSMTPLSKYRLILTGTQVTNTPFDLWAMFEFLQHNYFGRDYYSFCGRYGLQIREEHNRYRSVQPNEMESVRKYYKYGKSYEDIARIMQMSESSVKFIVENPGLRVPYKNLDELKDMVAKVSFQVLKKDCLDLPPKTYVKLYVDPSPEQVKIYKDLKRELEAEYGNGLLTVTNSISLLTRLQQVTGGFFPAQVDENGKQLGKPIPILPNPKIGALLDDLDEATEYPIIVVAHFVAEILAIQEALKKKRPELRVEVIYGDVDKATRNEIKERLNRGDLDVLVCNSRTMGTGHNLQASHVQYTFSNDYSSENREQMEDRIHRDGQKSDNVLYKDIIMRKTIDEVIYKALIDKRELLNFMRDKTAHNFLGGSE